MNPLARIYYWRRRTRTYVIIFVTDVHSSDLVCNSSRNFYLYIYERVWKFYTWHRHSFMNTFLSLNKPVDTTFSGVQHTTDTLFLFYILVYTFCIPVLPWSGGLQKSFHLFIVIYSWTNYRQDISEAATPLVLLTISHAYTTWGIGHDYPWLRE